MNLLFARFVMLMVMVALIAVAAIGQRESLAANPAGLDGGVAADCPAVLVQVAEGGSRDAGRRPARRAIRWQSFLPGTFR